MEPTPAADPALLPGVPAISFDAFRESFHTRAWDERIPIQALFELTYRCNFDCVHCYVVDPRSQGELTTEEVVRILGELRDAGSVFLTLTGGEVLARPDFHDVYLAARRLGFVVTVFTNGALVKERTLELFRRHPPHKVEITLYGASEETYRAVTRRRGMRDRVLDNVDRLRAAGVEVHLKAVGLSETAGEVDAIRAEARARGVDGFFRFDDEVHVRVDCTRGPAAHRARVADVIAMDARDPKRVAEYRRLYLRTRGRRVLTDRLFRCGAGRNSLVVDPFGQLTTCTLYRRERFDLRRGTVREAWERFIGEVVEQPTTRPTRCRVCDKIALCGACPGNNALESGGDPEEPPDFLCEITHARVEAFMADLRPVRPEPAGRRLPLHRARECARPWLAVREPLGELVTGRRGAPTGRRLPVARAT